MKNQKKFVYWVIVVLISIIVVGLVGIVWYYGSSNDTELYINPAITNSTNTKTTNTDTNTAMAPLNLAPQAIENPEILTLETCIDDLLSEDTDLYDVWETAFAELHPKLSAVYAGSFCELSNGIALITYSHQDKTDDYKAGQTIIAFDKDREYVNETKQFYCPTLGDLLAPHFKSLENGILSVYCWSGDAAIGRYEEFRMNLNDFLFEKTVSEEGEDVTLETYLPATDN
ncbi:hypothetical protein KJ705_01175 [Patescibacteria group bacterium]|nr:hypothetical protein [Patescibacteria group bacterium]